MKARECAYRPQDECPRPPLQKSRGRRAFLRKGRVRGGRCRRR